MALFREQRGGLSESLETAVIVKNNEELLKHVQMLERLESSTETKTDYLP